ncbi:MAG TPA: antibiotic biosynthesis monooxygenase [Kofleriaceae bacterium]
MAYVRIGQFTALTDRIAELRETYEREAIPAIRAAPGNLSAVLLQQHQASDQFLAITVWASEADAVTYDKSGHAARTVAKVRHTFASAPVLTTYDAYGVP